MRCYGTPPTTVTWTELAAAPIALAGLKLERPIITDDLRVLSTPGELLDEAKRLAPSRRVSHRQTRLGLPASEAKRLNLLAYQLLQIGLNDVACAAAEQWIQSPDSQMRWCGAQVLVYWNSPDHGEALRRFASSMGEASYNDAEARERVLWILGSWGVENLPPLVRAKPLFDCHQWSAWLSVGGCLLASTICTFLPVRRRRRLLLAIGWLLVCGIATLWVRSYWPRDALTWGNFDVVLERGNLYVEDQGRARAGLPSPLLVTEPRELLNYDPEPPPRPRKIDLDLSNCGMMSYSFWNESFAERYRFGHQQYGPWLDRLRGPVWKFPLWLVLAVLVAPAIGRGLWVRRRTARWRRARGFVVDVTSRRAG